MNAEGKNNMNIFGYKNDFWILDSRATNRMSCKRDWLTGLKNIYSNVHLLNRSYSSISKSRNFAFGNRKCLNNVLYLSSFKHNLILVGKMTKELSCSIMFYLTLQ